MSDGPQRSLPMRQGWKRVAERSDNVNFDAEDLTKHVIPALEQDCRAEMTPDFVDNISRVCRQMEGSLFRPDLTVEVQALRPKAGSGIGQVFLDNLELLSNSDAANAAILVDAMKAALDSKGAACARSVEEHFYRKSTEPRARNVRTRLEQAVGDAPTHDLARRILKLDEGRTERPTLKRGLDEGVRL